MINKLLNNPKHIEAQIQAAEARIEWAKAAKKELVANSSHLRDEQFAALRKLNSHIFQAHERLEELFAARCALAKSSN
jgi:hypothetical protein